MSPWQVAGADVVGRLPRTCGDEPLNRAKTTLTQGSAPHLRG